MIQTELTGIFLLPSEPIGRICLPCPPGAHARTGHLPKGAP